MPDFLNMPSRVLGLKCVQRLLRQHAYDYPVFVRSGFQKLLQGCRKGSLRHPRHQPERRVRDRAEHGLNEAGISVPVIYMTGNDNPAVRNAAVASGCIAFLTKPFSTQSLIEPLKRAWAGC